MPATPLALPVDVTRIQQLLPHRYPFLLVDRVVELEPNKRILAIKNVTINEPFLLEALAQAGGLLTQLSLGEGAADKQDKLFYLVKIDNARFSSMVVPGDRLDLEVKLKRMIRNMAMYECAARVDGKQVASADILCAEGRG